MEHEQQGPVQIVPLDPLHPVLRELTPPHQVPTALHATTALLGTTIAGAVSETATLVHVVAITPHQPAAVAIRVLSEVLAAADVQVVEA